MAITVIVSGSTSSRVAALENSGRHRRGAARTGPASGGGAVTYNNSTGEINFTPASVAGSTAIDSAQAIGIVDSNYVA